MRPWRAQTKTQVHRHKQHTHTPMYTQFQSIVWICVFVFGCPRSRPGLITHTTSAPSFSNLHTSCQRVHLWARWCQTLPRTCRDHTAPQPFRKKGIKLNPAAVLISHGVSDSWQISYLTLQSSWVVIRTKIETSSRLYHPKDFSSKLISLVTPRNSSDNLVLYFPVCFSLRLL